MLSLRQFNFLALKHINLFWQASIIKAYYYGHFNFGIKAQLYSVFSLGVVYNKICKFPMGAQTLHRKVIHTPKEAQTLRHTSLDICTGLLVPLTHNCTQVHVSNFADINIHTLCVISYANLIRLFQILHGAFSNFMTEMCT